METVRSLAQKSGYIVEEIDPERLVGYLYCYSRRSFEKLDKATKASLIFCPDCKGSKGFWNPSADAWSCISCLDGYKKSGISERKGYEPLEIRLFNVPIGLKSSKMDECDQNPVFKTKWKEWAKNPIGLNLFSGASGVGKSYAACACLREYAANGGRFGRFLNVSDLYMQWKELVKEGTEYNLILKYQEVELLVLDDIGQRTPTDSFLEFLYILLDKRTSGDFGTIVTTNLSYLEMRQKLGDALTSRISSGEIYKFTGSDRRVGWD